MIRLDTIVIAFGPFDLPALWSPDSKLEIGAVKLLAEANPIICTAV